MKRFDAINYSKEFLDELAKWFLTVSEHPDPYKCLPLQIKREFTVLDRRREMPLAIIKRYISLSEAKVLDAGCGTGRSSVLFAEEGAKVIGIDYDSKALKVALSRCKEHDVMAEFQVGNVEELPFSEGTFDVVIFHNVLEHVPRSDQPKTIQGMLRVLREGGVLFIQTPNRLSPWDIHTSQLPLLHWLPRRISRQVERIGIMAPREDLVSYKEIINALRGAGTFEVLNHCDVWENLSDYRQNWTNYTNKFGFLSDLYFRLVPLAYITSRIFRFELNKWLPNLNLFFRKG